MSTRRHNCHAELAGNSAGFLAQKLQLVASIPDVDVDVCRDLELRLKHFPHSLAASGPVYGFEKILRSLLPRFQCSGIRQEVLLFDTEGIVGGRAVERGARTNNNMAAIAAQAELQSPKNC